MQGINKKIWDSTIKSELVSGIKVHRKIVDDAMSTSMEQWLSDGIS